MSVTFSERVLEKCGVCDKLGQILQDYCLMSAFGKSALFYEIQTLFHTVANTAKELITKPKE